VSSRDEDRRWTPPVGPVDPEHPDCAAVIAEVWTLLDGECTPETRDKLKQHLEDCPACLRHYGVEERVKSLIQPSAAVRRPPRACASGCGSRSAAPPSIAPERRLLQPIGGR